LDHLKEPPDLLVHLRRIVERGGDFLLEIARSCFLSRCPVVCTMRPPLLAVRGHDSESARWIRHNMSGRFLA
jgi:hypothetical protein